MRSSASAGSEPRVRVGWAAALVVFGLTLLPGLAAAAEPVALTEAAGEQHAGGAALDQDGPGRSSGVQPSRSLRLLAALSLGKGLRFNNPYRLATPLGDTPESVSLSATYLDLGLAALLPAVPRVEHGVSLDVLLALDGIGQLGLTPSYLLLFEPRPSFALRGRLGLPLVIAPDASVGLEAGLGAQLPIAYGFGLTGELVGTLFFGAATEQKSVTTIPMLALQLGLCFDQRVLW